MPRGDKTGPFGQGPKTGRGMGFCGGANAPGYMAAGPSTGRGCGFRQRGGGKGWRRWAGGAPFGWQAADRVDPEAETKLLKNQAAGLQSQLEEINRRLEVLDRNDK